MCSHFQKSLHILIYILFTYSLFSCKTDSRQLWQTLIKRHFNLFIIYRFSWFWYYYNIILFISYIIYQLLNRYMIRLFSYFHTVPITIFPTPAKIVVQPGMNAFLHCQAYGNPRPRVSWSRDGYDVSRDPRFTVYPNGTLIIQRTLEQDMGSYLCVANNGVSTPAQRIVMLQLRGKGSRAGNLLSGVHCYV